jgi:hypothetical protein
MIPANRNESELPCIRGPINSGPSLLQIPVVKEARIPTKKSKVKDYHQRDFSKYYHNYERSLLKSTKYMIVMIHETLCDKYSVIKGRLASNVICVIKLIKNLVWYDNLFINRIPKV